MFKKKDVNLMPDGNKNSIFNFGPGWFTIIYCLLMFRNAGSSR